MLRPPENQAGYEALSYTTIGDIQMIDAIGDESEDIVFPILASGRVEHYQRRGRRRQRAGRDGLQGD